MKTFFQKYSLIIFSYCYLIYTYLWLQMDNALTLLNADIFVDVSNAVSFLTLTGVYIWPLLIFYQYQTKRIHIFVMMALVLNVVRVFLTYLLTSLHQYTPKDVNQYNYILFTFIITVLLQLIVVYMSWRYQMAKPLTKTAFSKRHIVFFTLAYIAYQSLCFSVFHLAVQHEESINSEKMSFITGFILLGVFAYIYGIYTPFVTILSISKSRLLSIRSFAFLNQIHNFFICSQSIHA